MTLSKEIRLFTLDPGRAANEHASAGGDDLEDPGPIAGIDSASFLRIARYRHRIWDSWPEETPPICGGPRGHSGAVAQSRANRRIHLRFQTAPDRESSRTSKFAMEAPEESLLPRRTRAPGPG